MNPEPITIKKYPNRRLYNTESSSYVTLRDLENIIREGRQVSVTDAKTDEDVTAFILTQIVMERAKRQHSILPVSLLHLLIRFGEDTLNEFFENYLEQALQSYLNYKKSLDEQFRICLELGIDLSSIAERFFMEKGGISMLSPQSIDAGRETGGKKGYEQKYEQKKRPEKR